MFISVNRVGDSITGHFKGQPFGVAFSEEKYALMKEAETKAASASNMDELKTILENFEPLLKEDYKQLIEHAQGGKYLYVNPHTGQVFLSINGKISNKPLPKTFVDRIIYSVDKKIDVTPLVKCWVRFLRNPWYSEDKARRFANYINTTVVNHELKTKLMEENGLSAEVAEQRATMYDVSFTNEGLD